MKYLKILLIIVLLSLPIVACGTGSMSSGETYITFIEEVEEPNTLNEWFCDLSLSEKIKIYNYWENK